MRGARRVGSGRDAQTDRQILRRPAGRHPHRAVGGRRRVQGRRARYPFLAVDYQTGWRT